ncbi:MAG: ribonuclease H-like YkuK family protein [bacterium]|nr:ribonuclease H-like YkuK family protein [bacterium]
MSETAQFHSWSKGTLTLERVFDEIISYINSQPERSYQIIIGSDSAARSPVPLVSAVTVRRVGNGAVHFWVTSEKKVFHTLRDRITEEALQSIMLAQEIRSGLREKLGEDFLWDNKIEVHIDVGENGPTRDLIDQVVGMVKGFGFAAVIKPAAFGASHVADLHT